MTWLKFRSSVPFYHFSPLRFSGSFPLREIAVSVDSLTSLIPGRAFSFYLFSAVDRWGRQPHHSSPSPQLAHSYFRTSNNGDIKITCKTKNKTVDFNHREPSQRLWRSLKELEVAFCPCAFFTAMTTHNTMRRILQCYSSQVKVTFDEVLIAGGWLGSGVIR